MTHSVLLLGCGSVAKPVLDILTSSGIHVTAACRTLSSAKSFVQSIPKATPLALDVSNQAELGAAIEKHDLVISLIPYTLHLLVVKAAVEKGKHVVTTSYISPGIQELDAAAKAKNLTILNESGMDPGLDHLYALKTISEVHAQKGKIVHFYSYCGGLPAPEASSNPLGFKFSWSPKGAILASMNDGAWIEDGEIKSIPGDKLMDVAAPYDIYPAFAFVAYPNRSSVEYKERYGIPEAKTVIRGSLRYPVYPAYIRLFRDLGLLKQEPVEAFKKEVSWREALGELLGVAEGSDESALINAISTKANFPNKTEETRLIAGLRWLGLLSTSEKIVPNTTGNPLDALSTLLAIKLVFKPGERDMVMLQHKFHVENADGTKETRTSTCLAYGDPDGYSAMARLVGVPCATAVKLVLDGGIGDRGVVAPVCEKISEPLLVQLRDEHGISFVEESIEGWV